MTKRKNGFFMFLTSLFPGAGEMYMGFYKQGVSIMTMFFALLIMANWLNGNTLVYLLPILWFYSFFHVHNLSALSDEEFYSIEDHFLFQLDERSVQKIMLEGKGRKILAYTLILFGASALWTLLGRMISPILELFAIDTTVFYNIMDQIPQILFAILMVLLGIYLIRGKKKELDQGIAIEEQDKDFGVK